MSDANLYAVSSPTGAGKTSAAVCYALTRPARHHLLVTIGEAHGIKNTIIVQPTKALLRQTYRALKSSMDEAGDICRAIVGRVSVSSRDVLKGAVKPVRSEHIFEDNVDALSAIEVDLKTSRGVEAAMAHALNAVEFGTGSVFMMTTDTFLAVMDRVKRPELFQVLLDESFQPVKFQSWALGKPRKGETAEDLRKRDVFHEVFDVTESGELIPKNPEKVREIAEGQRLQAGDKYGALQPFAKAVLDPNVDVTFIYKRDGTFPRSEYTMALVTRPDGFKRFHEVHFMAALFEATELYHLWTKVYGVQFAEHPNYAGLVDTHELHGPTMSIHWVLPEPLTASKRCLNLSMTTGKTNGDVGDRPIDYAVRDTQAFFSGQPYALQLNKSIGWQRDLEGNYEPLRGFMAELTGTQMPIHAHGLNDYRDMVNVAALACANPPPVECAFLGQKLGMDNKQVTHMRRIHVSYQAIGRISIRSQQKTKHPKRIVVLSREDAEFIKKTYPGSRLGGCIASYRVEKRLPKVPFYREEDYIKLKHKKDDAVKMLKRATEAKRLKDKAEKIRQRQAQHEAVRLEMQRWIAEFNRINNPEYDPECEYVFHVDTKSRAA